MNAGDKITFEGKEYVFFKDSGESHFFAQEYGNANTSLRRIAYSDFIADNAVVENINPRFVAFTVFVECVKTGAARNARFMSFIADALKSFAESKGGSHTPIAPFKINDQDEFTRFILENGKGAGWGV